MIIIALIINLIIVILEVNASINQLRHDGAKYFIFYTHISNIFAGITSALYIIFGLISLIGGTSIPVVIKGLRLMSTTTVTLTLIVVLTILAPSRGPNGYEHMMIRHNGKYVHFICPLLSIISFLFLEAGPDLAFYWTFITLIPTVIYGAAALICNYRRVWDGPYYFLKVHDQPLRASIIWGFAIIGGAYLCGLLLWFINSLIKF